ncbi:TOX high mobility group box family member 4 [Anopheles darlingi]|uniref:TOX high mobility group box family member 4 n=1 Tax=Anopheles darlingi TaxID=43151 RepID=UPI0021004118|nr:TOX high mobility group box family member 4 [Anopheles darlingi]
MQQPQLHFDSQRYSESVKLTPNPNPPLHQPQGQQGGVPVGGDGSGSMHLNNGTVVDHTTQMQPTEAPPSGPAIASEVEQTVQPQQCIRQGCTNLAIINSDWEDEYCSSECVVTHCRDVFGHWVQSNSTPQQTISTVK